MIEHIWFFVGLAFILTHEMDAVLRHEWRIFPLTMMLDDAWGYRVFTAMHVPLYVWIFWGIWSGDDLNSSFIRGWDIFLVVHVGLHLLFLRHPKNEFTTPFSWVLIVGAGVSGALDLLLA
jgi:hypothetical protein